MKFITWFLAGTIGQTMCNVLANMIPWNLVPDFCVMVLVFLSAKRDISHLVFLGLFFGYINGRMALAPPGLHEVAFIITTLVVYRLGGQFFVEGRWFFGVQVALSLMLYHASLFILSYAVRGFVGVGSFAAISLVPAGLVNGISAVILYSLFIRIEKVFKQTKQSGLTWDL